LLGPTAWIAASALCISVTALLSNLILMWLRWPRIVVEVAVRHDGNTPGGADHGTTHCAGDVVLLTVINNGSEAVTVKSVGLTQRGRGSHRLDFLHTWRGPAPDRLPIVHGAGDAPIMPLRIDGHGCHVFEYPPAVLSDVPRGVGYYGYAIRYQMLRWRPNHPMVRETRSKQTVMRSDQR
jgi:hypothetical protein